MVFGFTGNLKNHYKLFTSNPTPENMYSFPETLSIIQVLAACIHCATNKLTNEKTKQFCKQNTRKVGPRAPHLTSRTRMIEQVPSWLLDQLL